MTDRAKKSRHNALTVAYAAGALFIAILVVLLFRLEAGLDPAIGTAAYKVPGTEERKLIVRRKVIIRETPAPAAAAAGSAAAPSSGSVAAAPQTQSAPQSTPAPAPAPAPAPSTSAS